jgi:hypothetical protein
MKEHIAKIRELCRYALGLTEQQIYLKCLETFKQNIKNTEILKRFDEIKEKLENHWDFESRDTPEYLSKKYLEKNIFDLDLFDMHMIVYEVIREEIHCIFNTEIFPKISDAHTLFSVQHVKEVIHHALSYTLNCRSKYGNKPYGSANYKTFLRKRENKLKNIEEELDNIEKLLEK